MDGFNSPDGKMHPDDRRNLIIFAVLSLLVWFAFDHYLLAPQLEQMKKARELSRALPSLEATTGVEAQRPRDVVIADSARVELRNEKIFGSVPLTGLRLDDISLNQHFITLEKKDHIVLMSPAGAEHARYAEIGWLPGTGVDAQNLPGAATRWQIAADSADKLTAGNHVTMFWDNGAGLRFEREIGLDDDFLITVTQRVINKTGREITLYPYALIAQRGMPADFKGQATVHEGPIGYIGGKLHEISYKKMAKQKAEEYQAATGWIGITEKYWFTSIIPAQHEQTKYRFLFTPAAFSDQQPLYQSDIVGAPRVAKPGETVTTTQHIFSGAKEIRSLQKYEEALSIPHFDLAVDFGLWYFLTKPLFWLLTTLAAYVGNFGVAIIILTVIVRILVFPLANASFRSFAKMKKVAPQMKELREKHADDKAAMQQALVKLYAKEKVNPMAGCFPILIQIPIFFALFKVFSVSIEMRHAPFFGWINDLSQPDPTSIFNLFGLIPWDPPGFLMIGAWPCMMLFFMVLQQYLNPPPQDKAQAIVIKFMPFFMAYLLAGFASGLVVYWTFSNALSVLQQYILMRSMGVEVHLFRRSKAEEELEKQVKEGPAVHPGLIAAEHEIEEALEKVAQGSVTPPKPRRKKKR